MIPALLHKNLQVDNPRRFVYFAIQSWFNMNDLHKALGDISSIRRQVAHSTEFRGFGPATLAGTGVLAILAAGAQAPCCRSRQHTFPPT